MPGKNSRSSAKDSGFYFTFTTELTSTTGVKKIQLPLVNCQSINNGTTAAEAAKMFLPSVVLGRSGYSLTVGSQGIAEQPVH